MSTREVWEGKSSQLVDEVLPFSIYTAQGLTTCKGPNNPTWLYTTSRKFTLNSYLRAFLWTFLLVPMVHTLWNLSSSEIALRHIFNLAFIVKINLGCMVCVVIVNVCAPWPDEKDTQEHENDPSYLAEIGCVVPCHRSAAEITATVQSLLQFLKPEHIVVVDNGNSFTPLDNTRDQLENLDPRVQYMWVPIGLKTNALWMGLNRLPSSVHYVMHIDDDTICPHDMVFDKTVWDNPATDAVSYGIAMYQTGVVEKLVDYEFKQISQLRLFQSMYASVWFQHGIVGIWRREAYMAVLQEHPFLPFGEDNWAGTINLLKNRQMRQELRSYVCTYAPATMLPFTGDRQQGYGAANIWKQRAERWFVNAPRRFLIRLYLLFFYRHDTLIGNIVFRMLSLAHLLEIYVHLTMPMALFSYVISPMADWVLLLEGFGLQLCFHWLQIFLQNYVFWNHRKDVRIEFHICLLVPFYHWFLEVCFWYGHWRCLLWYIPFYPSRHGLYTEGRMTPALLQEMHKINTLPDVDEAADAEAQSLLMVEPTLASQS